MVKIKDFTLASKNLGAPNVWKYCQLLGAEGRVLGDRAPTKISE